MEPGGYLPLEWPIFLEIDAGMFHVEQIVLPVGEIRDRLVAGLDFGLGKINGRRSKPRRGAGLEPAQFQAKFLERTGKAHGRRFPRPSAGLLVGADVHQAPQKGSGGHDHGCAVILNFQGGFNAESLAILVKNFGDLALLDVQIRLRARKSI